MVSPKEQIGPTCSRCGAVLPRRTGGICPACALSAASETTSSEDPLRLEDVPLPVQSPVAPAADAQGQTTMLSSATTEKPGHCIGHYKLLQQIGEGGCGVVFMAEQDEPVRRRVALKVIKAGMDTKQVLARFEAERQALALMDHPNIAKVLDFGATAGGRPFFVMELVKGIPITRFCDENRYDTKQRLNLFMQVCHAVQHAHQKGIIHRDIKPSNILVADHDGVPVPKVIDFGLAKATNDQRLTDKTLFTAFEQFIGTPAYMSPEQARLSGLDIDTRTDIYSLGVLLYELLTGKTPFDNKRLLEAGLDEIRRIIREDEPPRPSRRLSTLAAAEQREVARLRQLDLPKLLHGVRGDLDWIAMKCLEKDRSRRYETANGLARDVQRHLEGELVLARPPTGLYRFQKIVRRNKLGFAAACSVVGTLVLGIAGISVEALRLKVAAGRADTSAQAAEQEKRRAETTAREAAESELRSRQLLYAADMKLAQESLKASNLGRAVRLLDLHRPEPGSTNDLRGWEWRYLWQQCQSDASAVLGRRLARVLSVSLSPDGRWLAAGYMDGQIDLWDAATRKLNRILQETSGMDAHVAFSPGSNILAMSSAKGGVSLLDLTTDSEKKLCGIEDAFIRDLSFSRDGRLLSVLAGVGNADSSVMVFDAAEGKLICSNSFGSISGAFFGNVRFSPDNRLIYVSHGAEHQPILQCFSLPDWHIAWEIKDQRDLGFSAMDVSPDGRFVATGTAFEYSSIQIRDARTGAAVARLEGHSGWIGQLTFSTDGKMLASASADQTIRLWDVASWNELAVLRGHQDEVHSLALSQNGRSIATGGKDGAVMLWQADSPKVKGYSALPVWITGAKLMPGGSALLAQDKTNALFIVNLITLRETPLDLSGRLSLVSADTLAEYDGSNMFRLHQLSARDTQLVAELAVGSNVGSFAYCAPARLLAWGDGSTTVHLVNLAQPANRTELVFDMAGLQPAAFEGNGRFLIATDGWELRVWDLDAGSNVLATTYDRVQAAEKGGALVIFNKDQLIFRDLYNLAHPSITVTQGGSLTDFAFSPSAEIFALGTEAAITVLYDLRSGKKIDVLHGHMSAVHGLAFSPDGRRLASSCGGKEAVKLWDMTTRQELLNLSGHGSVLDHIEFSDDGNKLLVGSDSGQAGTWQLWQAPSWAEIEESDRSKLRQNSAAQAEEHRR